MQVVSTSNIYVLNQKDIIIQSIYFREETTPTVYVSYATEVYVPLGTIYIFKNQMYIMYKHAGICLSMHIYSFILIWEFHIWKVTYLLKCICIPKSTQYPQIHTMTISQLYALMHIVVKIFNRPVRVKKLMLCLLISALIFLTSALSKIYLVSCFLIFVLFISDVFF